MPAKCFSEQKFAKLISSIDSAATLYLVQNALAQGLMDSHNRQDLEGLKKKLENLKEYLGRLDPQLWQHLETMVFHREATPFRSRTRSTQRAQLIAMDRWRSLGRLEHAAKILLHYAPKWRAVVTKPIPRHRFIVNLAELFEQFTGKVPRANRNSKKRYRTGPFVRFAYACVAPFEPETKEQAFGDVVHRALAYYKKAG